MSDMNDLDRLSRAVDALRSNDPNVEDVCRLLRVRSIYGEKKYGTTTERTDLSLRDWLRHLQEELLDAAVYIERLKSELPGVSGKNKKLKATLDALWNILKKDPEARRITWNGGTDDEPPKNITNILSATLGNLHRQVDNYRRLMEAPGE